MVFQPGIFSCTNPSSTQSSKASSCSTSSKKSLLIFSCSTLRALTTCITHLNLIVTFLQQRLLVWPTLSMTYSIKPALNFPNKYAPPAVLSISINATSTYSVTQAGKPYATHSSNHISKFHAFLLWNCSPSCPHFSMSTGTSEGQPTILSP